MLRRLVLLLAVIALAGCGNERTQPPNIDHPVDPVGTKPVVLDGITFTAPANWQDVVPTGSLVGGVKSKTATVAVWRYARQEPLPESKRELEAARDRLVARVRAADPTLQVQSQRLLPHGVEVVGTQTIAGVPVGIRSAHVFQDGEEVVVDAYAPPEDFARVDAAVFAPLIESLKVQ